MNPTRNMQHMPTENRQEFSFQALICFFFQVVELSFFFPRFCPAPPKSLIVLVGVVVVWKHYSSLHSSSLSYSDGIIQLATLVTYGRCRPNQSRYSNGYHASNLLYHAIIKALFYKTYCLICTWQHLGRFIFSEPAGITCFYDNQDWIIAYGLHVKTKYQAACFSLPPTRKKGIIIESTGFIC